MGAPQIPIRNVYYLFLYAWGRFHEGKQVEVGTEDSPDIVHLLARVLRNGVQRLLKRGLDRGYDQLHEELVGPRGRISFSISVASGALGRNRVVCQYDELTADVPQNWIIKSTLCTLANRDELRYDLADDLRALSRRITGVCDVSLTRDLFRGVQLSRNNAHYDLLLKICEMALDIVQPVEDGSGSKFASILEDGEKMSTIFEDFVRNFLGQEQDYYAVSRDHVKWDLGLLDVKHAAYLPTMKTDVVLRSETGTLIIDAKFYKEPFKSFWGGKAKIDSLTFIKF